MWHAVEVAAPEQGAPRGALYFFSGGSTRCLRDYDDNWADGLWADLEELKERARPMSTDVTRTPVRRRASREATPG